MGKLRTFIYVGCSMSIIIYDIYNYKRVDVCCVPEITGFNRSIISDLHSRIYGEGFDN